MPDRLMRIALAAAAAALAGCGTVDDVTHKLTGAFTPYKVEVVQGNFISKEQVAALQTGMSRDQVRAILGTPLVSSVFHADRWDYVFTLKRRGVEAQQRKLTVYFNGPTLARVEGDPMPSEAEFVATLDNRRTGGRIPPLEATEDQLRAASTKSEAGAQAGTPAEPPAPAAPVNYPPLEPPAR